MTELRTNSYINYLHPGNRLRLAFGQSLLGGQLTLEEWEKVGCPAKDEPPLELDEHTCQPYPPIP